jgi:hypothetical protein
VGGGVDELLGGVGLGLCRRGGTAAGRTVELVGELLDGAVEGVLVGNVAGRLDALEQVRVTGVDPVEQPGLELADLVDVDVVEVAWAS